MTSILLVDDEPDILESMAELVRRRFPEVDVRTATDGLEGLAAVEAERPDLIISDFRMPGMNGLEFLTQVHQADADIPSILLTAFDERNAAQQAARQGIVRRFFLKPPDVDQILAGIEELMDPGSLAR